MRAWDSRQVAPLADLRSPGGRAFAALFVLTHFLLTLDALPFVRSPAVMVGQLGLATLCTVLFVGARPLLSARNAERLILLLSTTITAAGCANFTGAAIESATWHWGAVTFLLTALAVRGRLSGAWAGFGASAAVTIVWTSTSGAGLEMGVAHLTRHAALLVVITFFALAIASSRRRTESLREAGLRRARDEAAARAALDEQQQRMQRLRDEALPELRLIASGQPLTAQDRARIAVLEAGLRDSLRGVDLLSDEVREAVAAARRRGITVTLLDDRGGVPVPDGDRARIEKALVAALNGAVRGHVTARLPPPGRAELVTVVADDGTDTVRTSVAAQPER